MTGSVLRIFGQMLVYGGFAALIGYFSQAPSYRHFSTDQAVVTLSFTHGAKRKGPCRELTREELEKLAPNMRKPTSCPRERLPVAVKLELDGRSLFEADLPPTGIARDGPSTIYRKFVVSPGPHRISAFLSDSGRKSGFDFQATRLFTLTPAQNLAIDFRADMGGFIFY